MSNRRLVSAGRVLSRLDLASVLIALVLLMAIIGSLFPQMPATLVNDPAGLAAWENAARTRYGSLTGLLAALGAFYFAASPLFLVASGLLIVATVVCSLGRWRTLLSRALDRTVTCSDDLFESTTGATIVHLAQAHMEVPLEQVLRKRRYRVSTRREGDTLWLRADRHQWALLGTLAVHLAVPLFLLGFVLTAVLGTRTELSIDPRAVAMVDARTGFGLRNDGFWLTTNPDGSPSSFEARVTPVTGTVVGKSRLLRVNEPLTLQGYSIYLASYWEVQRDYGIVLIVARDPGYLPVMAAGILMLLGLAAVLWFPHTTLYARLGPEGALCIRSVGGRYALDPEPELAAIATHLEAVALPDRRASDGDEQR